MKSRQDPFFLYWRVENVQLKTDIFAKFVWLDGWFLEDLFLGKTIILRQNILRYYLKYYLSVQYTTSTNNLCHETCRIVFIKMTAISKLLLARPKMAQMVKMPFIVFHLARLIFTGQSSHLDMIYP